MKPVGGTIEHARMLFARGRISEAAATLTTWLRRKPDDVDALELLVAALSATGDLAGTSYYCHRLMTLRPAQAQFVLLASQADKRMGKIDAAIALLRSAIQRLPDEPDLRSELTMQLVDESKLDEAQAVAEANFAKHPESGSANRSLGIVYQRQGRMREAMTALRKAIQLQPGDTGTLKNLAELSNYDPHISAKQLTAAHRVYGAALAERASLRPFLHPAGDDPHRRLRIGLISPDFRTHSLAYFARAIVEHLSRDQFQVVCFYTRDDADDVTREFAAASDEFVALQNHDPVKVASVVHHHRIDVLIELCGLFWGNSLPALVYKPAPVQVTMLGYANTTGIRAIDYRVVDSVTDPAGTDELAVEKLVRLDPCFLCYTPLASMRAEPPAPARRDGSAPFVFASFNHGMKLNDELFKLWGRIVSAVPGSLLLLKANGLEHTAVRDSMKKRLVDAGVPSDQIELRGRVPDKMDHIRTYHQVDLGLDTFPYHGTTTTCEAMLMGVPVLTLAGDRHLSRVGVSINRAVGLEMLIATTAEEYIERAIGLARDRESLAQIRGQALRDRLLSSPLCDAPTYGKRLGDALRQMWHTRCGSAQTNQ